jgi:inosine/xanthosine triphosphate pyrophosphatase family protein
MTTLLNGVLAGDLFEFSFHQTEIKEILEVDILTMVQAEVVSAYSQLRIPCIVEHAGLVFDEYRAESYPGGLTKPMWNVLGDRFVEETRSADRGAVARAVIAYCDGASVRTFVGETHGYIAGTPRGARKFYWDTVFIPDEPSGGRGAKTYAEIVETEGLGKKLELSQSRKAMRAFLDYRLANPVPALWSGGMP